jgi:hypothetical protein
VKKIAEGGEAELPAAKLYLEDLQDLYKILAEENPTGLYIRAADHELTTPEELAELQAKLGQKRIFSFEIGAAQPSVSLRYSFTHSNVHYDTESTQARGIASRLVDRWKVRRRLLTKYAGGVAFFLALIFMWATGKSGTPWPIALFMGFFAYLVTGVAEQMAWRLRTVVYLIFKAKHETFWQRNSDKVWLAVISAVAGGGIALAFAWVRGSVSFP